MSHNAPERNLRLAGIGFAASGSDETSHLVAANGRTPSGTQETKAKGHNAKQSKVIVVIDAGSPQSRSVIESLSTYNEEEKQRLRNVLAQELLNPAPPFETPSEEGRGTDYVTGKQTSPSVTPALAQSGVANDTEGPQIGKSSTPGPGSAHSRRYSDHLPPSLTAPVVKPMISNVPNDFSTTTVHIDSEGVVHPVGLRPITMMNLESKTFHRMEDEKAARRLEEQEKARLSPKATSEETGLDAIAECVAAVGSAGLQGPDCEADAFNGSSQAQGVATFGVRAAPAEEVISSREARAQALYDAIERLVEQRFTPPWQVHALFDVDTPPEFLPLRDNDGCMFDDWIHARVGIDLSSVEAVRQTLQDIKGKSVAGIHGFFASYLTDYHHGLPGEPSSVNDTRMQSLSNVAREVGVKHFIGSFLADLSQDEDRSAESPPNGLPRALVASWTDRRYLHKISAESDTSGSPPIKYITTLSSCLTFTSLLSSRIISFNRPQSPPAKLFILTSHLPLDCLMPFSHKKDVGPAALLAFLAPEEYNGRDLSLISDLIRPRLIAAQCDQMIYHSKARVTCLEKDEAGFLAPEEREWFKQRGWEHCWELLRWWLQCAKSLDETTLRVKTQWRLTAWRHFSVENTDAILPNWQQSLVTHPNHLDANEAPTRFDRPPVQQDQLDALNIFTDSMGHNFHDVPVGKARGSEEGEESAGGAPK